MVLCSVVTAALEVVDTAASVVAPEVVLMVEAIVVELAAVAGPTVVVATCCG